MHICTLPQTPQMITTTVTVGKHQWCTCTASDGLGCWLSITYLYVVISRNITAKSHTYGIAALCFTSDHLSSNCHHSDFTVWSGCLHQIATVTVIISYTFVQLNPRHKDSNLTNNCNQLLHHLLTSMVKTIEMDMDMHNIAWYHQAPTTAWLHGIIT